MRAGLEFDAPFTRLLERNNYRQALIDYQQDRRSFIQSLDSRAPRHAAIAAPLERAARQSGDSAPRRRDFDSPRRPDAGRVEQAGAAARTGPSRAAQFGPTAALNLLTALSDLRNTQNNFMSVWLNYYATRMQLMRELGLMQLDEEGRWIDTPLTAPDRPSPEEIASAAAPVRVARHGIREMANRTRRSRNRNSSPRAAVLRLPDRDQRVANRRRKPSAPRPRGCPSSRKPAAAASADCRRASGRPRRRPAFRCRALLSVRRDAPGAIARSTGQLCRSLGSRCEISLPLRRRFRTNPRRLPTGRSFAVRRSQ